ncbi:hypothetical protein O2K51_06615 [Apibacter raozihei]|uniref:hypothetical protein n=1 Tax=Apibacter raozihei TaxID=2500547 RepID=UPI000FE2EF54|nr:hypothetical protein [Apibacter raozihei]
MRKIGYLLLITISNFSLILKASDSLIYDSTKILPESLVQRPSEIYTGSEFKYEKAVQNTSVIERFFSWIIKKIIEFLNELFKLNIKTNSSSGLSALWISLSIIVIILLVIGFVFIYRKYSSIIERKDSKNISAEEAEKNIHTVNFEQLIQSALEQKNYRLALRFYYLKLLKNLSDKNLIEYKYQKTNYEYYYEIQHEELKKLFKEVSFVFDYCWYGDHEAQENDFIIAENKFNQIQNLILKLENKVE